MNWDELDAVNARLSETGDGALEVGHGGSGTLFYWDVDEMCIRDRSSPPPYPVSCPDAPITRWQGTKMESGLRPLARPTLSLIHI